MKSSNDDVYSSLGEEVSDQTPSDEDVVDTGSDFFIEEITE